MGRFLAPEPRPQRRTQALTEQPLPLGRAVVHHLRVPTPLEAPREPGSSRRLVEGLGRLAVFFGNDETAGGVINRIAEAGRRVPADIGLVDDSLTRLSSLTTALRTSPAAPSGCCCARRRVRPARSSPPSARSA